MSLGVKSSAPDSIVVVVVVKCCYIHQLLAVLAVVVEMAILVVVVVVEKDCSGGGCHRHSVGIAVGFVLIVAMLRGPVHRNNHHQCPLRLIVPLLEGCN